MWEAVLSKPHSLVEVIVNIAQDGNENLRALASEPQSRGLQITHEPLECLGIISGMAVSKSIDQPRKVNGMIAVEKAGEVHIAPPDSDVQYGDWQVLAISHCLCSMGL